MEMFGINLLEKTREEKAVTMFDHAFSEQIVEVVENSDATVAQVLRGAGFNFHSSEWMKGIAAKDILGKFNGNLIHISQIKMVADKYRLKFLPTDYYRGNIDLKIISEIQKFNEFSVQNNVLPMGMKILAPTFMFELEKAKLNKKKDPILFAQISPEYFFPVCKWGNDLTFIQRIKGFMNKRFIKFPIAWFVEHWFSSASIIVSFSGLMAAFSILNPWLGLLSGICILISSIVTVLEADLYGWVSDIRWLLSKDTFDSTETYLY